MARDHCASIGGHLAAINSARENDFLVALIGAIPIFGSVEWAMRRGLSGTAGIRGHSVPSRRRGRFL